MRLDFLPDNVLSNYISRARSELNEWHRSENDARKRLAIAERRVQDLRADLTEYLAEAKSRSMDPNDGLGTILYVGERECAKSKGFPDVVLPDELDKLRAARPPLSIVLCAHCYGAHSSALTQAAMNVVDEINGRRR